MDAQFSLAEALVATHGDGARALALARRARAGYPDAGDIKALAQVDRFLAEQAEHEAGQ